jgi:hypothetical protein
MIRNWISRERIPIFLLLEWGEGSKTVMDSRAGWRWTNVLDCFHMFGVLPKLRDLSFQKIKFMSFIPSTLGGYLFSSKLTPSILHVPNLFSMVVRFQNRFRFLSSPIISGEGKILPPLNQKGPPLGWKIWKIVGLLILIAQKKGFDALNATQKPQLSAKYR